VKRIIIGIIVIFFIMGSFAGNYFLTMRKSDTGSQGARILAQTERVGVKRSNTWVVKIDNRTITLDDFEREFNVHVYALPIADDEKSRYEKDENNKKKFLTNLVNEYLIYQNALDQGYEKRQDIQDLIKAVTRRAVIQVYLNEKIEPLLKDIPDEQIEAIYNQNKKFFAGVDIDIARQQIKMQLLQKQYNDHLNEIIDELKGEAKVIRNDKVGL